MTVYVVYLPPHSSCVLGALSSSDLIAPCPWSTAGLFSRTLLEHAWVPLLVSQKSTIIPLGRPVHRARQNLLGDAFLCVGLLSGHRDTYSDPDPQGRNVPVTLEPCVDDPKTTECMNAWVWNTDRFRVAQSRWPLSGIALWPSAGPRTTCQHFLSFHAFSVDSGSRQETEKLRGN